MPVRVREPEDYGTKPPSGVGKIAKSLAITSACKNSPEVLSQSPEAGVSQEGICSRARTAKAEAAVGSALANYSGGRAPRWRRAKASPRPPRACFRALLAEKRKARQSLILAALRERESKEPNSSPPTDAP